MLKTDEILEKVNLEADKWLEAFSPEGGKRDKAAILEVLQKRTYQGKPVSAYVVDSPEEAGDLLITLFSQSIAGKTPEEQQEIADVMLNAHLCIWDYYLMAYYESACSILPGRNFPEAEFIYQSMFDAYKAGLGFVLALGEVVIGVCMPEIVRQDDQKRLHCPDGPALKWGQYVEYRWHGTQVPKEWIIDKDSVNASLCLTHPNIEQRRCLCEIIGWAKVLENLDSKLIHRDTENYNNNIRELYEVTLPDSRDVSRFLKVICGTGRVFAIPVPNNIETCQEACAATYGVSAEEYYPENRT